MTRRDEWGTPRPTPDDGDEHAFDAAWRAAEREDSRRARSAQERITAAVRRAPEAFDREPMSEAERAWVEETMGGEER